MNVVVLLGPPGAGKGTVAEAAAGNGFRHVSTGDLLREQIRKQTPLGLEAQKQMDQGRYVPDDVVVGMIRGMIEDAPRDARFLFDGFPRTLVQAHKLDELVDSLGAHLGPVLVLQCPDEVVVDRLSGRRTCSRCGAVYHVVHNPPRQEGVCDVDGAELKQRPDDREKTVRQRLEVYHEQTAPLVEYSANRGVVHPVDATRPIEEVRREVLDVLG